jgi:hypothetical protein
MDEFLARAQHDEEISQVRLFNFDEVQKLLVGGEIYLAGVVGLLSRFLLKNRSALNISTVNSLLIILYFHCTNSLLGKL